MACEGIHCLEHTAVHWVEKGVEMKPYEAKIINVDTTLIHYGLNVYEALEKVTKEVAKRFEGYKFKLKPLHGELFAQDTIVNKIYNIETISAEDGWVSVHTKKEVLLFHKSSGHTQLIEDLSGV
jgi:hypothetical protein